MKGSAKFPLLFTTVAALWLSGLCLADGVVLYRQGETPNPEDIAKILGGGQSGEHKKAKTRGLKLLSDSQPEKTAAAALPPEESAGASSFALQIQFPFNSAEVQPDMAPALDAVAQGLKMVKGKATIVIEGHTDAAGKDDYNLQLSRKRAQAVKNYLVSRHGIPSGMLRTVGMGKTAPLVQDDPYAPENRRVQFRAADEQSMVFPELAPGRG